MRRIYLAARYSRREEMARYAADLEALGYTVTSRWHQEGKTPLPGIHTEKLRRRAGRFAQEDAEDTKDADLFIAFTTTPMASEVPGAGVRATEQENGGTHVEFGIAYALGKELWVVGPRENVFHCLPGLRIFPDWSGALQKLEHDAAFLAGWAASRGVKRATTQEE